MSLFTLVASFLIFQLATATEFAQQPMQRVGVTFRNSVRFLFDTDGNQVDAYASKVDCKRISTLSFRCDTNRLVFGTYRGTSVNLVVDRDLDGRYYLYGISHAKGMMQSDLKAYSSNDLIHW
jgi:hypothetical protein